MRDKEETKFLTEVLIPIYALRRDFFGSAECKRLGDGTATVL